MSTRTKSFHGWGVQPTRIKYSFSMGYSLLNPLWNEQSLNLKTCSWPTHAIYTLESRHCFCVMEWQRILMQVLLLLLFFSETKTKACGDSFGNTVLTYIHALILVTLPSSPTRTRVRKKDFWVSLIGGALSLFVSSLPEYYQDVWRRWWESSQLSALDV